MLNGNESFRFQRALYRAWILSALSWHPNDSKDTKLNFLSSVPDEELMQLDGALQFLDIMSDAIQNKAINQYGTREHASDIIWLLTHFDSQIFEEEDLATRPYQVVEVEKLYHDLLERRSIKEQPNVLWPDDHKIFDIMEQTGSFTDHCENCENAEELFVVSMENWHWMPTVVSCRDLLKCLPGRLSENELIVREFIKLMKPTHSYATLMNDMFDSQNDPDSEWNKHDQLCKYCIEGFCEEELGSWFVKRLVKEGYQFTEDCWYGWDCRTQAHDLYHAGSFNHLCMPLDEDDPVFRLKTGATV